MELTHLAGYFKQEKHSNADLLILVDEEQEICLEPSVKDEAEPQAKRPRLAGADRKTLLARFPAHRIVLAGADWFKAQTEEAWAPRPAVESQAAACTRPKLRLIINSTQQLPAAEAVIAALYCVPNVFGSLQHAQLVAAVVLADKIGAAAVADQAVQVLKAAAEAQRGLSAAAIEALASLTAWPVCLQPVLMPVLQHAACCNPALNALAAIQAADTGSRVQRMLLAVLGNLEAVWRDEQLQELLQQLPLAAMQLLLSSDGLRVASEDTVLYTASRYKQNRKSPQARLAAAVALAPLVRAPNLSGWLLSGQAMSSSSSGMLLVGYKDQLKQLVSQKLATGMAVPAAALHMITGAPSSWLQGKRQMFNLEPVQLVWKVAVDQIAQACRDSFIECSRVHTDCPISSAVLGGTAWTLSLQCEQVSEDGARGTRLGLFAVPRDASLMFGGNVFLVYNCTLACSSAGISHDVVSLGDDAGLGCSDFFGLGLMWEGGWDRAAWAAKGLPTSGEVELSLHMHSVGV